MPAKAGAILDQAIAWHLRVPTMGEAQWGEFVAWLEASPANRAEYDRVSDVDALVGLLPKQPALAPFVRPAARVAVRKAWAFGAAAALVVALAGWGYSSMQPELQVEQTDAGTVKQIAFAEGTKIDLNGETRLRFDQSNPREVRLDEGEALFTVHHSNRPFVVEAGGYRIKDLGTVFNVEVSARQLEVQVREGRVLFDPDGVNLTVGPGERVSVDRSRNIVVKSAAAPAGDWVKGELSFDNSSLLAVVSALHRRSGINIQLSDNLSNAPFTGNIRVSGDEEADAAHLASLIGASYRREGDGWVFSARGAVR